MRHFLPLAIVLVLTTTSCTSVREGAAFERINEIGQRNTGTLVLASGVHAGAEGIRITPDSTYWIDPATKALRSVPTEMVSAVSFRKRSVGASFGGAIAAVGFGTLLGAQYVSTGGPPAFVMGFAAGGIVGFLPGALAGFLVGGKEKYPISDSGEGR